MTFSEMYGAVISLNVSTILKLGVNAMRMIPNKKHPRSMGYIPSKLQKLVYGYDLRLPVSMTAYVSNL